MTTTPLCDDPAVLVAAPSPAQARRPPLARPLETGRMHVPSPDAMAVDPLPRPDVLWTQLPAPQQQDEPLNETTSHDAMGADDLTPYGREADSHPPSDVSLPASDKHHPACPTVGIETVRRWADLAEFSIDAGGDERVDALIMLAEELEGALEAALAAGGAPR